MSQRGVARPKGLAGEKAVSVGGVERRSWAFPCYIGATASRRMKPGRLVDAGADRVRRASALSLEIAAAAASAVGDRAYKPPRGAGVFAALRQRVFGRGSNPATAS